MWCRRLLGGYFSSPGLQTVVDYLTTTHPSNHCPPDLLLRGLLVPAWGVESRSHTTPVTHKHSLPELQCDSWGKSFLGQQHAPHRVNWQYAQFKEGFRLRSFWWNMMEYALTISGKDKMLVVWFTQSINSFVSKTEAASCSPNATWSETNWLHKLTHSMENYHPVEHWSSSFPCPRSRVCHSDCRMIWLGLYKQQHSWKKPKPSMSRSSLLTTVSEELWCALWQAPHLLTQGVSPGHAEVVTACVLGRWGPLLTEYFTAR